jgi:hypothetical protein
VEPAETEIAYAPFADALRTGTFRDPESGWDADQIGAHIAMNNDLLVGNATFHLEMHHRQLLELRED